MHPASRLVPTEMANVARSRRRPGQSGRSPGHHGPRSRLLRPLIAAPASSPLSVGGDHLTRCRCCAPSRPGGPSRGPFRQPLGPRRTPISAGRNSPMARRSAAPSRKGCSIPGAWCRSAFAARCIRHRTSDYWALGRRSASSHIEEVPREGRRRRSMDEVAPRRRRRRRPISPSTSTPSTLPLRPAPARRRSAASTSFEAQQCVRGFRRPRSRRRGHGGSVAALRSSPATPPSSARRSLFELLCVTAQALEARRG